MQDQFTGRQHALRTRTSLQARRVARVRALAGHRCSCPKRPAVALLYARSLKLKTQKEWKVWCTLGERTTNIPAHPDSVYKHDGWQCYGHGLGTANVH